MTVGMNPEILCIPADFRLLIDFLMLMSWANVALCL